MDWSNPFIIGPLCAVAGIFIGMLVMRLLDRGKNGAKALATLREEFDDYRTNVNEHFEKTSSLFQEMTEKYRDVYNHLASGAQQFGGSEETPPRLEIVRPAGQLTAATAPPAEQPAPAAVVSDDVPAEFDPSSLDESELADLAEPSATADEAVASPGMPAKMPEHRFRNMPDANDGSEDAGPASGARPDEAHKAKVHDKEPATTA